MEYLLDGMVPSEKITKRGNSFLFPIEDDKYGKLWYQLNFNHYKKFDCVYIEFFLIKDDNYIADITGTGHAKQIYSTVLNLVIYFIITNEPKEVCFSGKKDHAKFNKFYARAVSKYFPKYNLICYDDLNLYLFLRKDIEKSYIQNIVELYGDDIKKYFMEEEE